MTTPIQTTTHSTAPAAPRGVDHVTLPCRDLALAERFYVDVLGATVLRRLDEPTLQKLGWPRDTIRNNHAAHLQLGLDRGPRLEVFDCPDAAPTRSGLPHPHIGLAVDPEAFPAWKQHLEGCGVPTAGPVRLGRPGQASLYFDDPFGNHFELVALGVDTTDIPVGLPARDGLSYDWRPDETAG